MTTYQQIEWKELETKKDLTNIEISGKVVSIRAYNLEPWGCTSATFSNLTNTYFITGHAAMKTAPFNLELLHKSLSFHLPLFLRGYYDTTKCSLMIEELDLDLENAVGRISLADYSDSTLSLADQGKLTLK